MSKGLRVGSHGQQTIQKCWMPSSRKWKPHKHALTGRHTIPLKIHARSYASSCKLLSWCVCRCYYCTTGVCTPEHASTYWCTVVYCRCELRTVCTSCAYQLTAVFLVCTAPLESDSTPRGRRYSFSRNPDQPKLHGIPWCICLLRVVCQMWNSENTRGRRSDVCCAMEECFRDTVCYIFRCGFVIFISTSRRCRESRPSPRRLRATDVPLLTPSKVIWCPIIPSKVCVGCSRVQYFQDLLQYPWMLEVWKQSWSDP